MFKKIFLTSFLLSFFISNALAEPEKMNLRRINPTDDFKTARSKFTTHLVKNSQTDLNQGDLLTPPKEILQLVKYKSANGEEFSAYMTPPPEDGKKHPAILYARGGHGGLSNWMWDDEFFLNTAIKDTNIIVMIPAWRGDNYQGQLELYLGEADDAVAAINTLKSLPYVDSSQIYMMGHSTGGTVTLLTALLTNDLRAAFSFGGVTDVCARYQYTDYPQAPFDIDDDDECYIRSFENYMDELKTPVIYMEGEEIPEVLNVALTTFEKSKKLNIPFLVAPIEGGDHSNYIKYYIDRKFLPDIKKNDVLTAAEIIEMVHER